MVQPMSSIVSTSILVSALVLVFCPLLRKSAVNLRVGPKCGILILRRKARFSIFVCMYSGRLELRQLLRPMR